MQITACKLLINGIVQGVGFRPTVYKVATALNLSGWVRNTSFGVEVILATEDSADFIQQLELSLPALASLDSVDCTKITLDEKPHDFQILASVAGRVNDTVMPPDSYICQDCLAEIFDPKSKYYLYPFTNCTNCGPRYTVIKGLPYDRNLTALADFPLCESCNAEYRDPKIAAIMLRQLLVQNVDRVWG
jgi:hydrogenase maturation protein HypF